MNKKILVISGAVLLGLAGAISAAYAIKKKRATKPCKDEVLDDNVNPAESYKDIPIQDEVVRKNVVHRSEVPSSVNDNKVINNKSYTKYASAFPGDVPVSEASAFGGNKYKSLVDSILRDSSISVDDSELLDIQDEDVSKQSQRPIAKQKRKHDMRMSNFSVIEEINEVDFDSDDSENDIMTLTYFRGNNKLVDADLELVDNPKEILGKYYKQLSEYDRDFVYFRNHVLGLDIEVAFEDDEFVSEYDFDGFDDDLN